MYELQLGLVTSFGFKQSFHKKYYLSLKPINLLRLYILIQLYSIKLTALNFPRWNKLFKIIILNVWLGLRFVSKQG